MISWFKKHFIPHEGNIYRPHILRESATRAILIFVICMEIFSFLLPTLAHLNTKDGMAAVISAVLAELTNEERQTENLPTLAVNPILNEAALLKAQDMATKGYFAHTSPEGKTPWYWIEKVGYKYQYAGENLAMNFSDSRDVTNAWLNSPTHKANIVKENYTEMGTGIAEGVYKGYNTVFVAQVYANPLPKVEVQSQPTKKEIKITPEEVPTVVTTEEKVGVLGAEASTDIVKNLKPTFWQRLIASPRNTTNILLFSVFGIILTALILYIFIKIRNHHKDIISNGLLVLSFVLAILIANYFWTQRSLIVTDSVDYSSNYSE